PMLQPSLYLARNSRRRPGYAELDSGADENAVKQHRNPDSSGWFYDSSVATPTNRIVSDSPFLETALKLQPSSVRLTMNSYTCRASRISRALLSASVRSCRVSSRSKNRGLKSSVTRFVAISSWRVFFFAVAPSALDIIFERSPNPADRLHKTNESI